MKLVTLNLSLWWNRVFPFGTHCSKNGNCLSSFCWTELQPKGISLGALLQPSSSPLGSVCFCPVLNVRSPPTPLLFRGLFQALRNKRVTRGHGAYPGGSRGDSRTQPGKGARLCSWNGWLERSYFRGGQWVHEGEDQTEALFLLTSWQWSKGGRWTRSVLVKPGRPPAFVGEEGSKERSGANYMRGRE